VLRILPTFKAIQVADLERCFKVIGDMLKA
jgi:hypothetical protein